MATQEVHVKVCDPCNGRRPAVATRNFEWFGTKYRIDVCEQHDTGLRNALDKWIAHATDLTVRLGNNGPIAAPAGLYDKVTVLPGPEDRWRFTAHAEERMVERQINRQLARKVAQWGSASPDPKRAGCQERRGDGIVVVVNPETFDIVTVAGQQVVAV